MSEWRSTMPRGKELVVAVAGLLLVLVPK